MSVVTFWSNGKEQTGKTLSIAAIATYMAIEHEMKILVISTTDKDDTLENCFIERTRRQKQGFSLFAPKPGEFAPRTSGADMQNGMAGLIKIARSNKIAPDVIRNYTKVIFKTFEILFSANTPGENVASYFPDIINAANQYYDLVLVDLDANIDDATQRQIMQNSNLIIANVNQKISSVEEFAEQRKENDILSSKKTLIMMGKYDKFSKYTTKNVARMIGVKERDVLAIPYNTLYFEAAEEAEVPNLFLRIRNIGQDDRNYVFIENVKRSMDTILYKIQELQMNI